VLREILEDHFTRAPFDAIVMPSDTFFYVRAVPGIAHSLGVPFLVVQKETTISNHTMREHALAVGRYAPPLADRMTVCSERHKQFWLRAGADPSKISVTGQPRFDYYLHPERWPTSVQTHRARPTVLFLSYAVDAYHPDEGRGGRAWDALHRETEAGLYELARRGWLVQIKPHPQQSGDDMRGWRERAGALWNRDVVPVNAGADTRQLIVNADVVVGFQTTALLEAMIAGRPSVYTGWDDSAISFGDDLIPFHDWADLITVVRRPEEFTDAVASLLKVECTPEVLSSRNQKAEYYLGPLDGGASNRVLDIVTQEVSAWTLGRGPKEQALRERLSLRRAPLRLGRRGRTGLRRVTGRIGTLLGR
jgi:hypothetical protein